MNFYNGKFIVVEGPDKSGKTTLLKSTFGENNLNTETFICDRGIPTSIIYNSVFKRGDDFKLRKTFYETISSNKYIYILLDTPWEVIKERHLAERDDRHREISIQKKIYNAYKKFAIDYPFFITLDNYKDYKKQLEDSFRVISDYCLNDEVNFDILNAILKVNRFKEMMNYKINWVFNSLDHLQTSALNMNILMHNIFNKFDIYKQENLFETFIDKEKIKEIDIKEVYERNKIISDLRFNSHIQLTKYDQDFNSRRFVSVNDSCLSFVQCNVRDNSLYFTINFRSLNAKNNLFSDMRFVLLGIAREYYNFIKIYQFKKYTKKINKINIDINISSLHIA